MTVSKACLTTTNILVYVYGSGMVTIKQFVEFETFRSHMGWSLESEIRLQVLKCKTDSDNFTLKIIPYDYKKI